MRGLGIHSLKSDAFFAREKVAGLLRREAGSICAVTGDEWETCDQAVMLRSFSLALCLVKRMRDTTRKGSAPTNVDRPQGYLQATRARSDDHICGDGSRLFMSTYSGRDAFLPKTFGYMSLALEVGPPIGPAVGPAAPRSLPHCRRSSQYSVRCKVQLGQRESSFDQDAIISSQRVRPDRQRYLYGHCGYRKFLKATYLKPSFEEIF